MAHVLLGNNIIFVSFRKVGLCFDAAFCESRWKCNEESWWWGVEKLDWSDGSVIWSWLKVMWTAIWKCISFRSGSLMPNFNLWGFSRNEFFFSFHLEFWVFWYTLRSYGESDCRFWKMAFGWWELRNSLIRFVLLDCWRDIWFDVWWHFVAYWLWRLLIGNVMYFPANELLFWSWVFCLSKCQCADIDNRSIRSINLGMYVILKWGWKQID